MPVAQQDVAYSDKSYTLRSLTIFSSLGAPQIIDVSYVLGELTIFEDLYSSTMSGNVILADASNLIASLPLIGNEYISIDLTYPTKPYVDSIGYGIIRTFRIYKIDMIMIKDGTLMGQAYRVNFCSEEQFLSESTLVSKSYKGKTISQIVTDIVQTYLKPSSDRFQTGQIIPTKEKFDLIIPYMHPFQAIQWVTSLSPTPLFFYENNDGFWMDTLDALFNGSAVAKYYYSIPNVSNDGVPPQDNTIIGKVIKYEILDLFDTLQGTHGGMFASKLKTVDPVLWKYNETTFDYIAQFKNVPHIANTTPAPLVNTLQNRFGLSANQNPDSLTRFFITTKDHNTDPNITKYQPNINPNRVEQWMLRKISTIEQMNYFRLKLICPGNFHLNAGDLILFDFPNVGAKVAKNKNRLDNFSGKYLITAIRHKINFDHYEQIMEVVKDCVEVPYGDANNNDPNVLKVVKA